MISQQTRNKIIDLRDADLSYRQISEELGISKSSVYRICNQGSSGNVPRDTEERTNGGLEEYSGTEMNSFDTEMGQNGTDPGQDDYNSSESETDLRLRLDNLETKAQLIREKKELEARSDQLERTETKLNQRSEQLNQRASELDVREQDMLNSIHDANIAEQNKITHQQKKEKRFLRKFYKLCAFLEGGEYSEEELVDINNDLADLEEEIQIYCNTYDIDSGKLMIINMIDEAFQILDRVFKEFEDDHHLDTYEFDDEISGGLFEAWPLTDFHCTHSVSSFRNRSKRRRKV